ncbi:MULTISPECIES: hypothetical protein [unclassified Rathayibacter]|uniref:hypothetical protein n=1 Tax=unclassified Rathayibacter TaxID=2609250 RepID=UPI0010508BCA|nr:MULTISPECIES: hypothetical protein [unclassified Rathayibacter]TCL84808.1 hypothetical protein EDF49_102481 [Rathayibacter sp. PhB192]TCM30526.1 hypothetical protein EDF43_102481 [Rathayibacter sp. PhB179]
MNPEPTQTLSPVDEKSSAIRATMTNTVDSIRANTRISDIEKRDQIARAWLDAKKQINALASDTNATRSTRKQALERKLFGIPNTTDASHAISYRDALDRASAIDSTTAEGERQAVELMRRAEISGDTTLVRALLAVAYERQQVDVINAYANAHEKDDADLNELWKISTEPIDSSVFAFAEPQAPHEVDGAPGHTVQAWADGEY